MDKELLFLAHQAYELRRLSLLMTTQAGSGHPTSALSAADLTACIFFHAMHFDPNDFDYPENDRFILSKGHAAPLLYAAWHLLGKVTEDELMTYRQIDSPIEGHPTRRFKYAEAATGSLGQGLSIGVGYDLSRKLYKQHYFTYVVLGDSEISEGSVWEAAQLAAHYKTDHLIAVVDVNRLGQSTETLLNHHMEKLSAIWTAFGWTTMIIDGHDITEIVFALDEARKNKNNPTVILAKTYKGHPLHKIENKLGFHGKALNEEELKKALQELKETYPAAADYTSEKKWMPHKPHKAEPYKVETNPLPLPKYQITELIATRKAYGQALTALGEVNSSVVALDAEVKNSTFAELFEKKFPHRFVQCYIAEQNMIGMGAGFALRGSIPFISTFGAFHTRAFDQERMSAIGQIPLRLCGSHAGVSIGEDGPSQMALEDIALMRTLPESIVLYPSDAVSSYKLVGLMAQYEKGISYLRTTRPETPVLYENDEEFKIGGCKILKETEHDRAVIVGAGITLYEALKAHDFLIIENIYTTIIDLYSIKPLDKQTLIKAAEKAGNILITVEDHYPAGGIGEAVTSELRNTDIKIISLAVKKLPRSGSLYDQLSDQEIDASAIVKAIKEAIEFF